MRIDKDNIKIILILLVICLGIGYSYLNTELNINGTANINSANWSVYWNNVQVESGSVTASTPTIDSDKTTVSYTVTLEKPGDYYEFTVDAVNAGTIDAMIETIDSKLNGVTMEEVPAYLDYGISYSDDTPLEENQELLHDSTETYKVHIGYADYIEAEDLPDENQSLSLQFTVTYKQADDDAIEVNHPYLYNVLKDAATEGIYAKKYTGNHHDSFTEEPSKDIYHWWADSDTDGTAILDKNNVIFAGFCWQMIRTTDTGGVKLVYNGMPSNGQCNNSGIDTSIGTSAFNESYKSLAYAGYMYNSNTLITYVANSAATSESLFGTGVSYSGETYTLTNTSTTYDDTHHYTCNNTTGKCSTVRYYYYNNCYTEISDGRSIEQCLTDMLSANNVNQTNSTIKTYIDNWYASNMTSYTSKLEDTVFCDDRSVSDLGSWNSNGGRISSTLYFNNYSVSGELSCTNVVDKFSMANNKAKLTYPVGLLTNLEVFLLRNRNIRKIGQSYWVISPASFDMSNANNVIVSSTGDIGNNYNGASSIGVRPAVSLKPGTLYTSGDGSKNNPYIVE